MSPSLLRHPRPNFKKLAPRNCHPERRIVILNEVEGLSERFFALFRMTALDDSGYSDSLVALFVH